MHVLYILPFLYEWKVLQFFIILHSLHLFSLLQLSHSDFSLLSLQIKHLVTLLIYLVKITNNRSESLRITTKLTKQITKEKSIIH